MATMFSASSTSPAAEALGAASARDPVAPMPRVTRSGQPHPGRVHRGSTVSASPMIALLLVVAALASGCSTGTSTDSGTGTGRTGASTTGPSTTATTTPTPTPTPSETGTTSPTAAVTPTSMLGPAGYRSLKLGMSYADAVATGQLKRSAPAVWGWVVKGHPQTSVCLTKEGGLMAIFADATMASPEGIHLGSTLAEVNAAYPNLKRSVEFFNVPINATSRYEFLITVNSKTVYEWKPQHHQQTCFN